MKQLLLVWMVLFIICSLGWGRETVVFPRTPAPSPDGTQVAFSFQGDIWVVPTSGGEAKRLTANPAYDYLPRWSPDGKQIAFSSDRYGNDDVFVLSLSGAGVNRLTYFSNADRVWQFLPDGQGVMFSSRRNFYYHRLPVLYRVPLTGGTPTKVLPEYADQGRISADGQYLVFVKGRTNIYRKHYRGSSNADIFLYRFQDKTFQQLTHFDGNDMFPVFSPDGNTIYFASERDGTMNLYRMNRDGSNKTQLTFFKDDGIRYLDISTNGKILTFERGFDIYRYDVESGRAERIDIQLPLDYVTNPVKYQNYTSRAEEMAVSPDGKLVAFVVRGEVLVMSENGRFLNQLTESPWREGDICWAPNSDSLLYVSDEAGNRDIYLIHSGDPRQKSLALTTRFKRKKLIASSREEYAPQFSPDGKMIAFIRGKGDIVIYQLATGKTRTLIKGWSEPEFRWSPDSRYLAYAREDEEANSEVFIIDVETGKQWDISQHPDYDGTPRWSQDGRRIAFISARKGDNYDIWMAYLRLADDEKTDAEWEEFFADKKQQKKADSVRVVIDEPEKLYQRLRRVTRLPGTESDFDWSPRGQFLVFSSNSAGKSDLWKVKWNGKDLKQLTRGGHAPQHILWHGKNKKIYYLKKGGLLASVSPDGGKTKTLNFRATLKIDIPGEQKQKFDEAWRTLYQKFYDPNFHGVDWKAMYRKYLPIATRVYTIRDFNSVVRLMLGELNASHLGIYPPGGTPQVGSGMLGLRYDESYSGDGLKIAEVIPNGPCQRIPEPVRVGEVLRAVNGIPLKKNTNLYALLENRIDKPTELLLSGKKNGTEYRRTVVVRPISYRKFMDLEYDRWREEKRELVHRLSHNRLGYIHIRAMGQQSLDRFEMELYAEAHGKEGLVIDVRNNGGGWTTDYLLNMLMIRDHAYTIPRDGKRGYPQAERRPLYAWTKPIIVLCNEYSFSNAEIFSHAIKTLQRGKVVGKPTGGLVISTGSIRLIDGSRFRVPFRGWYVITNGVDMENHGAVPDIIVEDRPGDTAAHIDRQLERAVKELLSEL